jgi:hypothetical protein
MDSSTQTKRIFAEIPPETERVGKIVLDSAYRVHSALGPGLLESVYETCLAYEIPASGLSVETQVNVPVTYKDLSLEGGLRPRSDLPSPLRSTSGLSTQLYRSASQKWHAKNGSLIFFLILCVPCVEKNDEA